MATAHPSKQMAYTSRWLIPVVIWSLLIIASLIWNVSQSRSHAFKIATERGKMLFQMIELTRSWNALHGGVFSPTSDDNPPNDYLGPHMREIVEKSGKRYTRINPAYMTRQLSELGREQGFQFHLTSLNPLRPGNAADKWEENSLVAFETGTLERTSLIDTNGDKIFRYMAPLKMDPTCMECHAHQGYKTGDIRGGISINIDANEIFNPIYNSVYASIALHLIVWILVSYLIISNFLRLRVSAPAEPRSQPPLFDTPAPHTAVTAAEPEQKPIPEPKPAIEPEPEPTSGPEQKQGPEPEPESSAKSGQQDAITGMHNTRYFEISAPTLWQHAINRHQSASFLLIEVDEFHDYLKTYGQLEADLCLRQISAQIRRYTRGKQALSARHGVSAFVILASGLSKHTAVNLATSLLETVAELGIRNRHGKHEKVVTITCAVATMRHPSRLHELHTFIHSVQDCFSEARRDDRQGVIKC